MSDLPNDPTREITGICGEFEEAWISGQHPRIEDCCANYHGLEKELLVKTLIELEIKLN